jgi:alkylation response protein AidB-like acyl-CoA dehydrogenase
MYGLPSYRLRPAQRQLLNQLAPLLERFAARAEDHDREASFPRQNLAELRELGYLCAAVPAAAGGDERPLADVLLAQREIARACPATALAIGMHHMVLGMEAASQSWPAAARRAVYEAVVERGATINSISAEPELGSPKGGGRPQTRFTPLAAGGFRVDGHKIYCTMAPALELMMLYGSFDDSGDIGRLLVPMDAEGVTIDETWDALGMRATCSHDIRFENVCVGPEALLTRAPLGQQGSGLPMAWFALQVGAASLGIADGALDAALAFARGRRPTGYAAPIAALPAVRDQLARAALVLDGASAQLQRAADDWDGYPKDRRLMGATIGGAKVAATNAAVDVVDRCHRVVGGAALRRGSALERAYRDVRSGLVNPPIEARALDTIAKQLIDEEGQR